MVGRLWRQRRRLALCAGLGAAAGLIVECGRLEAGVAPALVAGGALAALAAIVVLAAPGWRWFALKIAVLALLAALIWRWAGDAVPLAAVAGAAGLGAVLLPAQLPVLDALRVPFIVTARRVRRLSLPAAELWAALRPRETAEHWDPHLRAIRRDTAPDSFVLVYAPFAGAGELHLSLSVFDVEDGYHFKTRQPVALDPQDRGPLTVTSYVVEPDGAGSRLTVMEGTWRQGLWTAFALWLDDYLAEHVDRMAALLEGRPDRSIKGAMLRAAGAAR